MVPVDASMAWDSPSAALEGGYAPNDYTVPLLAYAVKNPYAKSNGKYKNPSAGHVAMLLNRLGTSWLGVFRGNVGYSIVCKECFYAVPGTVYPLSIKVSKTGVATLSGKIGSKKVSATAVVRFVHDQCALATFVVAGMVVDLQFLYWPAGSEYDEETGEWDTWAETMYAPTGAAVPIQ